jgi:energy-coupling factor transporter ATP-binding protein EcfA2
VIADETNNEMPSRNAPPGLRLEWRSPEELAEHPSNWRRHPETQLAALGDIIGEVGWAGACLYNEATGRLIDGHARRKIAIDRGEARVPVLVGSWDEATEKKILLTLDPIAGMAEASREQIESLLKEVNTGSDAVASLLAQLAGGEEEVEKPKREEVEFTQEFSVLVKCQDEAEQREVLKELDRHNLPVRALTVDMPVMDKEPEKIPPLREGEIEIVRESKIERTPRVIQLEGMFDVPPSQRSEERWRMSVALDRPWQIGLIVGPSGSGKSTLARELFAANLIDGWEWPADGALVDGFPADMGIAEITGLLSSVGFSSPPGWLKPFRVLSNGEQFRVNLARTLAEKSDLAVVDEFTSVVDRTVAKIGSAAAAKAVRASGRRLVAVSCHADIEEWLQPDWTISMPAGALVWRSRRRRPDIQLRIERTSWTTWENFRRYHYLDHGLNRAAHCFLGTVDGKPAAFTAVLSNPHAVRSFWREHRTVCHPDFQGVGIGNAMSEFVAGLFASTNKPYRSTTSHPAMIRHRLRSPNWACVRRPGLGVAKQSESSMKSLGKSRACYRLTASFEWIGKADHEKAMALGVGLIGI